MRIPVMMLVLTLLLGGCGTSTKFAKVDDAAFQAETRNQRETALKIEVEDARRVQDMMFVLNANAADSCRNGEQSAGLSFAGPGFVPSDYQAVAASLYGWDRAIKVFHVAAGSPAAKAGFRAGDTVLAINDDFSTSDGAKSYRDAERVLAQTLSTGNPIRLALSRNGERIALEIRPVKICAAKGFVVRSPAPLASANGQAVLVPNGLLRYVRDSNELAAAVSHELAHNLRGHVEGDGTPTKASSLTSHDDPLLFQPDKKVASYTITEEREADRVGLRIMARAGFDISAAVHFWRRLIAGNPALVNPSSGNPYFGSAERILDLESEIQKLQPGR